MSNLSSVSLMRTAFSSSGQWAAGLAAVGGFVADVLNPLAPFAGWFALASLTAAVLFFAIYLAKALDPERSFACAVFALEAFAVSGGVWVLQRVISAENGVVAEVVPGVEGLQKSLGLIADTVQRVETKVDRIEAKTDDIAASVKAIADGFAALNKQGGAIAAPSKPEEFYHNARFHELGGDMTNARASYLGFARFGVDSIDAYLRFATLLRVQDGRAGAREVLGALREQKSSPALDLAHLLQFDDGPRREKLDAFIAANPEYGPAYKFLADESSEDKLGQQTLGAKKAEAQALAKFLSFEADGRLIPHFVDQTVLAEWLEVARKRQAALGPAATQALEPTFTVVPTSDGWIITASVPEAVTSIKWRLGETGEFKEQSAGLANVVDPRTGQKVPNPTFTIPRNPGTDKVQMIYADLLGQAVGPFTYVLKPQDAIATGGKAMLEMSWTSWLAFDASGNKGLLYFTQLAVFPCAIKEARYGFNDAALDQVLTLPPCNPDKPYALAEGFMPYMKVGDEVTSARLQITYADGSQSEVRTFNRGP
jgi:hypothetical protein